MFLFLSAAHGHTQVLLFTFVCENVSRKKQKALVVARPLSGPGFKSPQYPALFLLWLQAPLPCPLKDLAVLGEMCQQGSARASCSPSVSLWKNKRPL